jgi:hypothetical protein
LQGHGFPKPIDPEAAYDFMHDNGFVQRSSQSPLIIALKPVHLMHPLMQDGHDAGRAIA